MNNKLKVWDSQVLTQMLGLLTQVEAGIASLVMHTGVKSLNDLPPSTLPTSTLYQLCLCYEGMYEKLLEYDLLTTGNIKQNSTLQ